VDAAIIHILLIRPLSKVCPGWVKEKYEGIYSHSRYKKPEEVVVAYVEAILTDVCRLVESIRKNIWYVECKSCINYDIHLFMVNNTGRYMIL
jgi:hypothetical protein